MKKQHWRAWSARGHYVECFANGDPYDAVRCSSCGEEW